MQETKGKHKETGIVATQKNTISYRSISIKENPNSRSNNITSPNPGRKKKIQHLQCYRHKHPDKYVHPCWAPVPQRKAETPHLSSSGLSVIPNILWYRWIKSSGIGHAYSSSRTTILIACLFDSGSREWSTYEDLACSMARLLMKNKSPTSIEIEVQTSPAIFWIISSDLHCLGVKSGKSFNRAHFSSPKNGRYSDIMVIWRMPWRSTVSWRSPWKALSGIFPTLIHTSATPSS